MPFDNRKTVVSSLIFKFLERIGSQGISFVVQIILARLLTPSDYGMLTMLVVFINISQVLVHSGMNSALVQRKEVSDSDYSSVFYISLSIALVLYAVLSFCAPFIASFYNMPELVPVLRVLALNLIPGAFNSIQVAKAMREMRFKTLMYNTLIATIITGTIGIIMAYKGFGVWALVTQQISAQIITCVLLLFTVKWRLTRAIDFNRIKIFFSYGWKLMCSSLSDTLYLDIQNLVVGRKFSSDILGYYNRGNQYPQFIIKNINTSIQTVMFPVLSSQQDNTERLRAMMRRSVVTSAFVIFPIMTGLAVIAEPLVSFLLTDKWLPAVPYLQIYCFIYAFYPIHTANLQTLKAQGRSDIYLKIGLVKNAIGWILLFITVYFFETPIAVAMGGAALTLICCYINTAPNKKLINYGFTEQMLDTLPILGLSLVMGVGVYAVHVFNIAMLPMLIIQITLGAVIYISLAWLLKLEGFTYLLKMAKEFWVSRKKPG